MKTFLTLDSVGIVFAVALGILVLVLGGPFGYLFVVLLLEFLVLSAIVTRIGKSKKIAIKTYEKSRGWKNVVANGLVPLVLAIAFRAVIVAAGNYSSYGAYVAVIGMYCASVAAITSDKFASELGVLDGEPVSLIGLRRVKKGVSGGVTWFGLLASFIGALAIGLSAFVAMFFFYGYGLFAIFLIVLVPVSGFFGSVVDSVLGYFESRGLGSKFTTNFFCALSGALIYLLLLLLLLYH